MISTWALIGYLAIGTPSYGGGPIVVDNIASAEECERVRAIVDKTVGALVARMRCIEIRRTQR